MPTSLDFVQFESSLLPPKPLFLGHDVSAIAAPGDVPLAEGRLLQSDGMESAARFRNAFLHPARFNGCANCDVGGLFLLAGFARYSSLGAYVPACDVHVGKERQVNVRPPPKAITPHKRSTGRLTTRGQCPLPHPSVPHAFTAFSPSASHNRSR